ncbi:MAG: SigB/SigF/SigG family RNA polymerase sigma factor [Actinomycetota bacterium]
MTTEGSRIRAHHPGRARANEVQRLLSESALLVERAAAAIRHTAELRQRVGSAQANRAVLRRERARMLRLESQRDRLVRENLSLARQTASRFAGRGQSLDDLYQVACVGLVKAADRFDAGRGVHFRTYAHAVITGEIKRHFRDHGWGLRVARPVQELYLAVREARERLTQEFGRSPTIRQLADALESSHEDVIEAIQAGDTFYLQSMDAPSSNSDDRSTFELGAVETAYEQIEERSWLIPALKTLSCRDREILEMRFFEGLSQSQIADRVGISQMHVSRLLTRSLGKLRSASPDKADGT